jgi:hypothetical protein
MSRARVGVLNGFCQKGVTQSVQARIGVRVEPAAQAPHLHLEHPATERFAWVAWAG